MLVGMFLLAQQLIQKTVALLACIIGGLAPSNIVMERRHLNWSVADFNEPSIVPAAWTKVLRIETYARPY